MDIYYRPRSAPCRAVLMTAKAIGVELNEIIINMVAGDHLKPEFLKLNPQHTIPTLVDNGFALWESRAIMVYLVEQYAKTDSLYPNCPEKRAIINQCLLFDMGTLYQRLRDYYYPQMFQKLPANPEKLARIEEAFGFLNIMLEGKQYAAGDSFTLADIALATSVSNYDAAGFDFSQYGNVVRWYKFIAGVIPGYEINQRGMAEFGEFVKKETKQ